MSDSNVVLYSKPGCSLCEKAGRVVERVLADIPFDLEVVDITASSELLQRYGLYIPVITIDGIESFRYHVNESGFRALLNAKRALGTLRG